MNELEIKKKKLKSLLEGKEEPTLSIEEAKKRLRETDPGIDISKILKTLNNPTKDKLKILIIELLSDPDIIAYFAPILKFLIIKFLVRE